jgi:5-methyltetrahydrofolate--homocysteine methyltransferase
MFLNAIDDLDRRLARHEAFWNCEAIDRPLAIIRAPQPDAKPGLLARDDEQYISDPQFNVELADRNIQNTWYGGDALPDAASQGNQLYPCWGGTGRYESTTVWVQPSVSDWRQWRDYTFDYQNIWIKRYLGVNKALAQASKGRYLVSTQGFFGAMDALAVVRGYCDFILELALPEATEVLMAAQARAIEGYKHIVTTCWDDAQDTQRGTMMYPGIWAPGRINWWSGDFTCLIGPKDFQTWVMPEFQQMADLCEYPFYHLDGPDAVRHLPSIMELKGLKGIQYEPGPSAHIDFIIEVAGRIQAAGLCTWVRVAPCDVERIVRTLSPRGLAICADAPNPQAGQEMLRNIATWTARH